MYAVLWRVLPGPWPVKVIEALVLAAIVVAVLFRWVFPVISPLMPFTNNTVDAGRQSVRVEAPAGAAPASSSSSIVRQLTGSRA